MWLREQPKRKDWEIRTMSDLSIGVIVGISIGGFLVLCILIWSIFGCLGYGGCEVCCAGCDCDCPGADFCCECEICDVLCGCCDQGCCDVPCHCSAEGCPVCCGAICCCCCVLETSEYERRKKLREVMRARRAYERDTDPIREDGKPRLPATVVIVDENDPNAPNFSDRTRDDHSSNDRIAQINSSRCAGALSVEAQRQLENDANVSHIAMPVRGAATAVRPMPRGNPGTEMLSPPNAFSPSIQPPPGST